jgi:threonine synthase
VEKKFMKFRSVRGESPEVGFREALFRGLAPDGSLYIPKSIPPLPPSLHDHASSLHLPSVAADVLSAFIDDITREEMLVITERAFNFPIPLIGIGKDLLLLELVHGPTLAFKDVGARFMALVLSSFLQSERRELTIAVATSGDTGGAVAHGFHSVPNVSVYVFYPSGKISPLQEQQVTTLGGNIHPIEVEGTFDDCQQLVKRALMDTAVVLARNLTTANSINLGRLLPQICYYVWAMMLLRNQDHGTARSDRTPAPVMTVPSGNFGNLTAAVYAMHMGAPISKFIAACNANDVIPEYFRTGVFRPRPSLRTFSNAMDVGNPSNFARLGALYQNSAPHLRRDIMALSITDQQTIEEIRRTYGETGYILDPHTAVGVAAARGSRGAFPSGPIIVAATAHPAKFPEVVDKALGITVAVPEQLQEAMKRQKKSTQIAASYDEVRRLLLM